MTNDELQEVITMFKSNKSFEDMTFKVIDSRLNFFKQTSTDLNNKLEEIKCRQDEMMSLRDALIELSNLIKDRDKLEKPTTTEPNINQDVKDFIKELLDLKERVDDALFRQNQQSKDRPSKPTL